MGDEELNDKYPNENNNNENTEDNNVVYSNENGQALNPDMEMNLSGMNENNEQQAEEEDSRITTRFITKYERARVLGVRATQISMGAPIMIELTDETDPLEIALKEFLEKKHQ